MSQENVEILKRAFDAINRGDTDGWAAPLHPDVHWQAGPGSEIRGRDKLVSHLLDILSTWDDYMETPEQFLDLGDDVVVLVRVEARLARTGTPFLERHGEVHTFRDGHIVKLVQYESYEAALKAVSFER